MIGRVEERLVFLTERTRRLYEEAIAISEEVANITQLLMLVNEMNKPEPPKPDKAPDVQP